VLDGVDHLVREALRRDVEDERVGLELLRLVARQEDVRLAGPDAPWMKSGL
jgi:hypothetical protein